jgi:hypothetical protein
MKRYLFEYRFGDAEYGFEIPANSLAEARERLKALTWARYEGEIKATIRIPGAGLLSRIAARLFPGPIRRLSSLRGCDGP